MSGLSLLAWPFLACLIFTAMLVWFGLHIVERGVIFVDLSLAQMAALGTTLAFLAGYDLHGRAAYLFSLGFTFLGAGFFAFTRIRRHRIPQEAVIGIVYAVASAAAIVIVDRSPEGAEHIKYILVGNLLTVTPVEVARMAGLYAVAGTLQWAWRKRLLAISTDPAAAESQGIRLRLWDLAFYAVFGVVITSAVAVAGVLLVFTYLIVPAVAALLWSNRVGARLVIGWGFGTLASLAGMLASLKFDTPTGATIVCVFGGALAVVALVRLLLGRGPASVKPGQGPTSVNMV